MQDVLWAVFVAKKLSGTNRPFAGKYSADSGQRVA